MITDPFPPPGINRGVIVQQQDRSIERPVNGLLKF